MNTDFPLRLSELLISRLCHDLVTPIGAINTGLELFQETSPEQLNESQEILNLISHSGQTASARISFFRVAFGSTGGRISLGEARQLIDNYFQRSKLEFSWQDPFENELSLQGWGRVLLNAILWLGECAPRGGRISVTVPKENELSLTFKLSASPIIIHQGTLEALEGKASLEEITPRNVPCYLIHYLIKQKNGQLTYNHSSTELNLQLHLN